jgi:hypothetical protein
LQAVIDYGEGDANRAAHIRDVLENSITHCRKHEAKWAIRGQSCQLSMALFDWVPAVDSVCWFMDQSELAA